MNEEEIEKFEEIDKKFEERLSWITSREYKLPERYKEMCNTVRDHYKEFVKDIFDNLKKTNINLKKELEGKNGKEKSNEKNKK